MGTGFYQTSSVKHQNTTYLVNEIVEFVGNNKTHFIF